MTYSIGVIESGVFSTISSRVVPDIKIKTEKCSIGWSTRFTVGDNFVDHDLCTDKRADAVELHRGIFNAFQECIEKIETIHGIKEQK